MFCPYCGKEINDNADICLGCGRNVKNIKKPVCDNERASAGWWWLGFFFPLVGFILWLVWSSSMPLRAKKTGDFGNYDKITIALICFFLGSFGVHNFMLGENKKGIAKLITLFVIGPITCGIGEIALGVLVLVEFIKILTNKYVVDPNKII